MNWQEIKEKYPKSYKLTEKWLLTKNAVLNIDSVYYRHLYNFFDKNGIWIDIEIDTTPMDEEKVYYCYRIVTTKNATTRTLSDLYYTRTEAEEQAFNRAFEILETRLK